MRVGSPNCSVMNATEEGGWASIRSRFLLVVELTVDGNDVIFRTPVCDMECMKLMAVKLLLNVSLSTAQRLICCDIPACYSSFCVRLREQTG